jgi:hypothetical protein
LIQRLILITLLLDTFLVTTSFFTSDSQAWSNGGYSLDPANPDYGTHDWLAQHALDWLPTSEKQYITDNLAAYLYGTELPDNGGASDGIGDTTKHHIYYNQWEEVFDDAAAARAATEYNDTLTFLKAHDYVNASKNAGIMTHYIADMAVFSHVMGASTPWGTELHHSDYEDYVNDRTSSHNAEFNAFLLFDGSLDAISPYEAAKKLAYDSTFDLNGNLNCTWMDQNYNWSNPTFKNRAGEALNLAANYLADVLHTLYLEANMPTEFYLQVPHHYQTTSYWCGPAALEMVFDYYGSDIPQSEIADAARTASPVGTYATDMIRAAHFSNLSTSVGYEMPGSITGYTARKLGYATQEHRFTTIDQLKFAITLGYPIIVLTTNHFRVAVGYSPTHITFQDPWYGSMYKMTFAYLDTDWDYSNHWAQLVTPWKITLTAPTDKPVGIPFNVTATITYPSPPPFSSSPYTASKANTTLMLPMGMSFATGHAAKKPINNGTLTPGETTSQNWAIQTNTPGTYAIGVEAEGKVAGSVPYLAPEYPAYSYNDRIGGRNQTTMSSIWTETTPPTTTHDYNDVWHPVDFRIFLTATDTGSGVKETYYRVNNNPTQTVTADDHPLIDMESANNTLEYWSIDNAGNEETHHTLTNIKLDMTAPTGSIIINNGDAYTTTTSITLSLTVADATSGIARVRYTTDGRWDSEDWETPSATRTWTLPPVDGTITVYYMVKDNADQMSETYTDTIVLDTTAPTLAVTSPEPNIETRSSTITVTWTGSDQISGINYYRIRLDAAQWINKQANTTHTFTDLPDGTHTVYIEATDKAGTTKQDTVTFIVNTSPILGPGYIEEAAIIAAIIAAGIAVAYLAMRKRKK